jgi:hypothetical protein
VAKVWLLYHVQDCDYACETREVLGVASSEGAAFELHEQAKAAKLTVIYNDGTQTESPLYAEHELVVDGPFVVDQRIGRSERRLKRGEREFVDLIPPIYAASAAKTLIGDKTVWSDTERRTGS